MSQTIDHVLQLALSLPAKDRLTVAQELWQSVDPYPDVPVVIDDALLAEINRRDAEMRSGAVHPLTHEELMSSLSQDE